MALLPDELPEGWATSSLGETITINYGKGLKKEIRRQGIVPVYGSNGKVGEHDQSLTNGPSIILGRKGSVGEVHYSPEPCWPIDTTYFISDFGPFEAGYLTNLLKQLNLSQKDTSTAIPGLNRNDVYSISVPVPPLAEQKRIVAKVEELFARINAAREHLNRIPSILKRFRQSVLAAACSGKLTEDWRGSTADYTNDELPDCWKLMSVEDLLPKGGIFDGPFGSNLKTSDYTDSGVRVIRLENIAHLKFIEEKRSYVSEEKYRSLVKHTVGEGDIIFGSFIDGDIRVCLLPKLNTKAIAKADCFCLRPYDDLVDRQYLVLQLASHFSRNALMENIHGATRPRINTKQLRKLNIRLCPRKEQQEIVKRVKLLMGFADKIENRFNLSLSSVDQINQSILQKSFQGELVPLESEMAIQERRDYEPADVLLARIKAEREAAEPKKKTRKAGRKKKKEPIKKEVEQTATPLKAVEQAETEKPAPKKKPSRKEYIFNTDEVMRLFRTSCRGTGEISEDDMLREVARQLDYQRLTKGIKQELKGHLKTAVRRNIIERNGSILRAATPRFNDYEDDFLRNTLKSVMRKGYEYDRNEVTKAMATYLGFSTVTQSIRTRMKSIYNSGIRRGMIGSKGQVVWRKK